VERVREALVNMLGPEGRDAVVMDLYAGSGSLGIEALSRGAKFVAFVDQGHPAIDTIHHNLKQLPVGDPAPFHVIQRPVERSASPLQPHAPFDLVLIDPPFAAVRDSSSLRAVERLLQGDLIHDDTLVVLEYPSDQPTPTLKGLHVEDDRLYGDTHLCFLRRHVADD
jgi:16S rRNA (guanine966-N2)-methyltransferase